MEVPIAKQLINNGTYFTLPLLITKYFGDLFYQSRSNDSMHPSKVAISFPNKKTRTQETRNKSTKEWCICHGVLPIPALGSALAFAFDTSPGLTGATVFGGGGNGRDPLLGGGDISPAPTGLAFTGGALSAGEAGAGAVAGGLAGDGAGSGGGSAAGGASLGTGVGVAWAALNHGTPS